MRHLGPASRSARPLSRHLASLLAAFGLLAAPAARATPPPADPQLGQAGKDVIWIPTPEPVLVRMLSMAQVGQGDHVYDLGAGDGRLVLMAARQFGARATGVEYDDRLVAYARKVARREGLSSARFRMVKADLFTVDFRDATVVGVYLLSDMLNRLRPTFQRLRPGTRIVSHHFKFDEWEPDEVSWVGVRGVYLWIVPADVAGGWRLTTSDGLACTLAIEQKYQRITGRVELPAAPGPDAGPVKAGLRHPELRGDQIRFSLVDDRGRLLEFSGRASLSHIEGSFRAGDLEGTWRAERMSK